MLYDPNWKPPAPPAPAKVKKVKPKSKRKTWRTLMLAAADVLEKKGWIRGSLSSSAGFCTIGALRYADGTHLSLGGSYNSDNSSSSCRKAEAMLTKHLPGHSIISWNDRYVGGKQEVIDKLREVAKG